MNVPTEAELDALYEEVSNWGRWGDDDERGMLNHLAPAHRVAGAATVVIGATYDGYESILTEDADTGEVLCDFQMPGSGVPHVDNGDACTDFDGNPCLFSFDVTFDVPGSQAAGSRTCDEFGWYDGDTWGLTFGYGYVDDYMYNGGGYGPRFMYQYGGSGYSWYYTFYTDVTWAPDSANAGGDMTYQWFYGSDFYVP